MEFKVKGKVVEIKFDFALMFKIDKKLATVGENGQRNNDGVGALFASIISRELDGIVQLISLCASQQLKAKSISEDDVLEAIENYLQEKELLTTEELFTEIQEEMVDSGFFKEAILKYIGKMEKAVSFMGDNEEYAMQAQVLGETISEMKSALS